MKRHVVAAVLTAVTLASFGGERAEAVERKGFLIGFSAGGGALTCDDCDSLGGVSFDFHLGGMVTDRLAVMAEGYGVTHPEGDDSAITGAIGAVAAQYWVSDKVWIKGGIGAGDLAVDEGNTTIRSDSALAFIAGAGAELIQKEKFVLDVQGRFGTIGLEGSRVNMWSANLGFNWY